LLVISITMESNPQLSIELVWEDVDLEELRISAYNGCYSGTAKAYFAQGDVGVLADSIRGFPKTHGLLFTTRTVNAPEEYRFDRRLLPIQKRQDIYLYNRCRFHPGPLNCGSCGWQSCMLARFGRICRSY
jgi:hypothetical protein